MSQPNRTIVPDGNLILGYPVNAYKFSGVAHLDQLEQFGLKRPTFIDKEASKSKDQYERSAAALHAQTNRRFDKARTQNAEAFSGYIQNVEQCNQPGGVPKITLFCPTTNLEIIEQGIVLPYGSAIVAIDGETQTEARYMMRDRLRETKQWKSSDFMFDITLYHGVSVEYAMQILHDYNTLGLPWSESKAAVFNRNGGLSKIITDALKLANLPESAMNIRGDKVTKDSHFTHSQALMFAYGMLRNGAGMGSVTPAMLKQVNQSQSVPATQAPIITQRLADLFLQAKDDRNIGMAPRQVWQVAGVAVVSGVPLLSLNWKAAIKAYADTQAGGRGGPRMGVKARLTLIDAALKSAP